MSAAAAPPRPAEGPRVRVLYFAWLRERVGRAEEEVTLPAAIGTVGDLLGWMSGRGPGHAAAFANPGVVRCAVNQVLARADTVLASGDEVALFPPVTGG